MRLTIALSVLVLLLLLVRIGVGSAFSFSFSEMMSALVSGRPDSFSPNAQTVLWEIRMPRAFAAAMIGANLAMAGAIYQALFRNPLADPYVLGVSSGAALGGVVASLFLSGSAYVLGSFPLAFGTALAGILVVMVVSRSGGRLPLGPLLLGGVAIGTFLWALITFLLVQAGRDASKVLDWLLGTFVAMTWAKVALVFFLTIALIPVLIAICRPLTLFAVGEESAARLGVDTERLKWLAISVASALAAVSVATAGIIGFVGLFAPHIARKYTGPKLARLLPVAALLGAAGMLLADLLAQKILPGVELNVGIVTAIIGAPFLLAVMRRKLTVGG